MGKKSQNDIDLNIGSNSKYDAARRAEMLERNRMEARGVDKAETLQNESESASPVKPAVEKKKKPAAKTPEKKKDSAATVKKENTGSGTKKTSNGSNKKTASNGNKNTQDAVRAEKKNGAKNDDDKRVRKVVRVDEEKQKTQKKKTDAASSGKKSAGKTSDEKKNVKKPADKVQQKKKKTAEADKGKSKNERLKNSAAIRRSKNKKGFAFRVGGIIVIMMALLYIGAAYFIFNVSEITVDNPGTMYSDEEIIAGASVSTSDNLLRVASKKKEAELTEKLPYIESANIKKVWPNKLALSVEYAKTAISLQNGPSYVYINSSAKVLSVNESAPAKNSALITGTVITSAEPGHEVEFDDVYCLETVRTLAEATEKHGIEKVSGYDIKNSADVSITVDNKIEVKIGSVTNAVKKLAFGKEVIDRYIAEKNYKKVVIDLTSENRAYVRTRESDEVIEIVTGEDGQPTEETTVTALTGEDASENTIPDAEVPSYVPEETTVAEIPETTAADGEVVEFG